MIKELRTLIAIERYGTFGAAAERLGLTQSAVSGHVKRLEEMLGVSIFERTRRSAELNAAGLATIERAREIVVLFDSLAGQEGHVSGGKLQIGAISSVQSTLLARALSPVRKRFPRVHIRVVPGLSLHLFDQLNADELDLAIIVRPSFELLPRIKWHKLVQEPYMLLVPSTATGGEWRSILEVQPFIRYDRASFAGRQVDQFLRVRSVALNETMELDDISTIITMVSCGFGVALVPVSDVTRLPENIRAVSLGSEIFYREIGLAHIDGIKKAPLIDTFVRSICEAAGTLPCVAVR